VVEDEIILEHFDVPDCFNVTITVSCDDGHTVRCTVINKENTMGSAIHQSYAKYGSKIGTITECIINSLENVLEK
jgi:hypothetical protein